METKTMSTRVYLIILCCAGSLTLQGCGYVAIYNAIKQQGTPNPEKIVDVAYDPAAQARIRLDFSGSGYGYTTPDSECYKKRRMTSDEVGKVALDTLKTATVMITGVLPERPTSISIKMPKEKDNRAPTYFHEEVISASKPVSLKFSYASYNNTCDPPGVYFLPIAGKDYKASLELGGGKCWVAVFEIDNTGKLLLEQPVITKFAPVCRE